MRSSPFEHETGPIVALILQLFCVYSEPCIRRQRLLDANTTKSQDEHCRTMGWRVLDCAEATCLRNRPQVPADPDVAGIGVRLLYPQQMNIAYVCSGHSWFLDNYSSCFSDRIHRFVSRPHRGHCQFLQKALSKGQASVRAESCWLRS